MSFDPEQITQFAKTDARGTEVPFGIKAKDRTRHVYVIGKTGMGKSTLLENMAVQDIQNGNGLAFIDPHGQTAETLLEYIPDERKEDVLYFAPFDTDHPVAFNVMEDVGPDKRHLVVSGLMSVFKKIWVDAWSARMEYILQNTLLALLEYPDSTLLGVNRMLSDKTYRKKVVNNITDPAVKSFWVDEFANYNERYMQEAGDAIKNKIGQFTANPLIRNIVGQPKSSFDIRKIMDEKKILIMNLSKGLVGESNANLLGSMLTTRIYLAAMSRADLTLSEMKDMPNFYFYVDEFQSFANATFADILSEARKYKLNLTIAHQYIEQMEEEVRNAVFGNVGTIISFRVGPFDAEVLETVYAPNFTATDIVNLGFAQIYLTLMIDGIGSHPFSAVTLPPIEPASVSYRDVIVNSSRQQFTNLRGEVEDTINTWHDSANQDSLREHQEASAAGQQRSDDRGGNKRPDRGGAPNRDGQSGPRDRGSNTPNTRSDSGPRNDRAKPKPKPAEGKSLDELRSILGSISEKENTKGAPVKKVEQKSDEPRNGDKPAASETGARLKKPPEHRSEPKQSERPGKESGRPKKESISSEGGDAQSESLKDALAAALKDATPAKPTQQKREEVPVAKPKPQPQTESKPAKNQHTEQRPKQSEKPVAKNETASDTRSESKPKPEPKPEQSKPARGREEQPAPTPEAVPEVVVVRSSEEQLAEIGQSHAKPSDPLAPKKLQRMMRLKGDDHTPIK